MYLVIGSPNPIDKLLSDIPLVLFSDTIDFPSIFADSGFPIRAGFTLGVGVLLFFAGKARTSGSL